MRRETLDFLRILVLFIGWFLGGASFGLVVAFFLICFKV